jgi:hypothetical protein
MDVWVLGEAKAGPVVAHWDGVSWTVTTLPLVGSLTLLSDIAAASATDVWVAGITQATHHAPTRGLIYHWDGVDWSREAVPDVGGGGDTLNGVTTGAGGTWAVGEQLSGDHSTYTTLVLERQSGAWVHVPSPNMTGAGHQNYLHDVADASSTAAIAVGDDAFGGGGTGYVMSWDGQSWTIGEKPRTPGSLNAVAGGPGGRALAVGTSLPTAPFASIRRRSGKWVSETIPPTPYPHGNLGGAAFPSPTRAWAVGYSDTQDGSKSAPLIAGWDGTGWTVTVVSVPSVHAGLNGVAAAGGVAWAVGGYRRGNHEHALLERYC